MGNNTAFPDNQPFDMNTTRIQAPNRTWNIEHNFTSAGFFMLECIMSNVVSSQLLTYNVKQQLM
jgi:hypothetical protein